MKTGLVGTLIDMISVLYVFAKSYPHSIIVVLSGTAEPGGIGGKAPPPLFECKVNVPFSWIERALFSWSRSALSSWN